MACPVMTYTTYSGISGDLYIEKLHDFAVALGWTINDWKKANCSWDTTVPLSGWQAGLESWLDIKATGVGFGGSNLRYVFRNYHTGLADTDGLVVAGAYTAGTYSSSLLTHPVQQSSLTWGPSAAYREISLPTTTMAGAWFFGNAYCIWSVIQPTSGTCILWGIGQPTLYPEYYNAIQTEFVWAPLVNGNTDANHAWYNMTVHPEHWSSGDAFPFYAGVGSVGCALLENVVRTNSNLQYDYSIIHGRDVVAAHYWQREDLLICHNSYCAIRPGIQPSVMLKRVGPPVVWQEIGTQPFCHCRTTGLAPGATLTYGAEQWLAFPNVVSSYSYGKMFRIV